MRLSKWVNERQRTTVCFGSYVRDDDRACRNNGYVGWKFLPTDVKSPGMNDSV
jgi:hypothetical protein